ncbi:MAG: helix-turn-helix domain-containing protein [Pontiella sp.]
MSRWHDYDEYEYVSVAERRRRAAKKIQQLQKDGDELQPIEPFKTRGIATSFWGRAWCRHLEQFSDYSNRLPRGRSYVRNGSVCHLAIEPETAKAMVSGSEMYELSIHIDPLCPTTWSNIKNECKGKIGSLIELLQGRISDEIMTVVTDREKGLFPHPNEIRFNCNCPDWADMCKHVAASMYGIGVRLDTEPELLFKLRGVNHEELIAVDTAIVDLTAGKRSRRRRTLQSESVASVFGIDLNNGAETTAPLARATFKLTAESIRELREKLGLSQNAFAKKIGVSAPSIAKWEKAKGTLNLQAKSRQSLQREFKKAHQP